MKLKDTIHFNWYKHLFIVLVIGLCVTASAAVTEADILDVLGNLEQMSGFLSRFLRPDFAYIPKLIGPMISTLQMSVTGTALGVLFAVPVAFLGTTVVTGNRLVTSAIRFFLDIVRTIPNLLLAALMVAIVGEPFAGDTAIHGLDAPGQAADFGPHDAIAATGVYLDYDTIGRFKYHSDEEEVALLRHMCERGYTQRLLLSLDTTAQRMAAYGGDVLVTKIKDLLIFHLVNW